MITQKLAPDLIRGENRFAAKIMLETTIEIACCFNSIGT